MQCVTSPAPDFFVFFFFLCPVVMQKWSKHAITFISAGGSVVTHTDCLFPFFVSMCAQCRLGAHSSLLLIDGCIVVLSIKFFAVCFVVSFSIFYYYYYYFVVFFFSLNLVCCHFVYTKSSSMLKQPAWHYKVKFTAWDGSRGHLLCCRRKKKSWSKPRCIYQ